MAAVESSGMAAIPLSRQSAGSVKTARSGALAKANRLLRGSYEKRALTYSLSFFFWLTRLCQRQIVAVAKPSNSANRI